MRIDRRKSRAGFTLIEILVAFTILGLAGATIMSILGNGTMKVSRAENERLAILSARSALALVGTEVPLEAGTRQGKMSDGGEWTIIIQSYDGPDENKDNSKTPMVTEPYLVTVQAITGAKSNHASATLSSVRLKPVAP